MKEMEYKTSRFEVKASEDDKLHIRAYALVFGNEQTGLPPRFAQLGQSVLIPQSKEIDSLNLAVAVSIGTYVFTTTK
jgi:tRNA G18 (ribose-2'-O)-methylase SpoU